jgi:UDP-3-O-[3-hydroxymyristoyl] glucosamine N-acyltransferase
MADPRFYDTKGPYSLEYLANYSNCSLIAPANKSSLEEMSIDGIADLKEADTNKISVFSNLKYKQQFLNTSAGGCIVSNSVADTLPNTYLLQSANAYYAYARLIDLFYSAKQVKFDIEPKNSRYISASVKIGKNCTFGYNVVIEDGAEIGDNCFIDSGAIIKAGVKIGDNAKIGAGSYISYAIIGNNVILLPGARIGQDGYGYATDKGVHHKIFHIGRVIIGNNVEIGANTTIDRGSINDTIIGDGCKIDNLVQIGHNVVLGKGCLVVAQVGIAGSTHIGDYCAIGGQSGISGHLNIASQVQIAGGSGVIQDITQDKIVVGGYPAVPVRDWHKQSIFLKKLINKKQ